MNSNTSEHHFKSSSVRTIEEHSDPLDKQAQTLTENASSGFSQYSEDGGGDIDDIDDSGGGEDEEAHCNSIDGNDDDVDDVCLIYETSAHQSGVNSLHMFQQTGNIYSCKPHRSVCMYVVHMIVQAFMYETQTIPHP